MINESYGDLFNDHYTRRFQLYGSTYSVVDAFGRIKAIHSIDPAVVHAVLVSSSNDWTVSRGRRNALKPLAQSGVLLTDGKLWHTNRKMLHRYINTSRSRDTKAYEVNAKLFFDAIGPPDESGWTPEVNLSDLLRLLAYDMSTFYQFRFSADLQLSGILARCTQAGNATLPNSGSVHVSEANAITEAYLEAFEVVRSYVTARGALGTRYWMMDGLGYRRACKRFEDIAALIVNESRRQQATGGVQDNHGIIDHFSAELKDLIKVRDSVLDLTLAGQNMTGTMLEWIFAELAEHTTIYARLRDEILSHVGEEGSKPERGMPFSDLKSRQLLQNVISERLRCHPLVATMARTAVCDTVLPHGGGVEGDQPIGVPKGAAFNCNVYLMHRREEDWGDESWEWKPDRWAGRNIGPEYIPFGSGPRVCMGRQLSLTQISFILARFVQRVEAIHAPEGVDNLSHAYRATLSPKNGVKVSLKRSLW